MPLNPDALAEAIETAFEDSKANGWTTGQVAAALAAAIDEYVRGGAVTQVTVNVATGAQIGTGRIE